MYFFGHVRSWRNVGSEQLCIIYDFSMVNNTVTCFTKAGITFHMPHVTADCAMRYFLLVSFPRISSCLFLSWYFWYMSLYVPFTGELEEEQTECSLEWSPVPALLTRHWKMQVSFPPIDRRWLSLCVNRTLVTWLPWPSYL